MSATTPGYFIFDSEIFDPELLTPYLESVGDTIAQYGGKILVQGGQVTVYEGNPPTGIVVIVKFNSIESAKAWYQSDVYQSILPHRLAGAKANGWLVAGTNV